MSVEFAEGLLKRIEAGQPDLGWNADELRAAIDTAKGLTECPSCGKMKPDVGACMDPYDQEIHNKDHEITICGDCYKDLCDSI